MAATSLHQEQRQSQLKREMARRRRRKIRMAVSWAECGVLVIPLRENDKKPIHRGSVDAGLIEPSDIRQFFQKRPDANYGVATGVPGGILVLDIDGPAGAASLRALEEQYGHLPVTTTVL